MNSKNNKGIFIYIVIGLGIMMALLALLKMTGNETAKYDYSQIIKYFDDYKVSEYSLDLGSGELKMTVEGMENQITYTVPNVGIFLNDIQGENYNYRKEYNELHPNAPLKQTFYPIQDTSWLVQLIPTLLLLIVMVVLFVFMMRQANGGGKINQFGKANIKAQSQSGKKTTFADVAGAEEEKNEMAEIVDFLKNPKKYLEIGARIPKGVLLLGPPGTGKTLLARAVAGEAGVPFFSISGSDFVEMFVGVGASRVRDLFETAKKNSPSIVFIDEIDAVGRQRGTGLGGGHDEREQTLNQLLVEMDGFTANDSVIVIAATNRRDILDPALLRPGRFDRQITVGRPDVKGREEVLKVHTRNKPLAPDVDLAVIARTTAGFTGADLENMVNEAALLAARANRKAITMDDIFEASIKVVAGPEKKSHIVTEEEKKLTAYHEAGHAILSYYLPTQDRVQHVTIIPRGEAGGFTMTLPEKDQAYVTKTWMCEEIVTLLGGRVAEKLILNEISTGAASDIDRATRIAHSMVTRYGFSEKLGPIVYGHDRGEVFLGRDFSNTPSYSENVAAEIDSEVRQIVEDAYEKAMDMLNEHMDDLHKLAGYLLEHEKIDGPDFEKLMKGEFPEEPEKSENAPETSEVPAEASAETPVENTEASEEKDASSENKE